MKNRFASALFIVLVTCSAVRSQNSVVPTAVAVPTTVKPSSSVEFPSQQPPQPSRLNPPQPKSAASVQLGQKLAALGQLQKEIDELRTETQTPSQVLVRIEAIEVNLTKAHKAKLDVSALVNSGGFAISGNSPDANPQVDAKDRDPKALLAKLEQSSTAKILASPTLVVVSGRPATFNVGGQFPDPTNQQNGVEFREFGTKVDVQADCLGNNKVRLHVRPRISDLDENHQIVVKGIKVPGLSVRQCDFTSEMSLGQSAIVSGLVGKDMSGDGAKRGEPVETMFAVVVTPEAVGAIPKPPAPPTLQRVGKRLIAPVPTK